MFELKKHLKIKDLNDQSIINAYHYKLADFVEKPLNINDPKVFWYQVFNFMVQNSLVLFPRSKNKEDSYIRLLTYFELETMVYIYIYYPEYRSLDMMKALCSFDFSCEIIDSLMCMSYQWYNEDRNPDIVFNLWQKFNLINGKTVFDDDRFSIYPLFTNGYKRGMDRSNWIRDLQAGWLTVFEESTQSKGLQKYTSSAYCSNYLDAKIGFVIYFKNMPSIVVSFNCDKNWNLYVHQIQCKPKDRGHYKIKNWQLSCLKVVKQIFSEYNIYLISGNYLSDFILEGYSQSDDIMKPSNETLKRVADSYDSILEENKFFITKNSIGYREIF